MTMSEKYDRLITGFISGFLFPVLTGLVIYLFSSDNIPLFRYLKRIIDADIMTHIISLCVFPNILLFLMFNRLDMLRATRGVLGITIIWAVIVFGIKFLG